MKKYLGFLGGFYFGFSLSYFADINFLDWKFWVIVLPVFILFSADKKIK